ncbi:MAG: hypothetical protein IRY90_07360 [Actinomadura rubrobrunea]|nr:hypothetical protein [Actinomadura rubrobrunea]
MQFKTINPWHPDDALYSGWFTVPTNNYVTVSKRPQRYSYKLCATFGGGTPGVMYWWRGFLEVE